MTRPHDMKHLDELYGVAVDDVEHLKMKEATYQGSWKRSGGRSAWFMLRRKIDRLLEMMKRPESPHGFTVEDALSCVDDNRPLDEVTVDKSIFEFLTHSYLAEDIFAKIEQAPVGEDGSVLAEVRDLRRYLLLVEAEMTSRGVVSRGAPTIQERRVPRFEVPGDALQAQFATEGKGAFGGLAPWLLPREDFLGTPDTESSKELLDQLYDEHGAGLMKLVPHLSESLHFKLLIHVKQNTSVASRLFGEALDCYAPVRDAKSHVLDASSAPPDYRGAWPRLRAEYNAKELGDLEPWCRDLYYWIESQTKYRIKPGLEYWTVGE